MWDAFSTQCVLHRMGLTVVLFHLLAEEGRGGMYGWEKVSKEGRLLS